MPADDYWQAVTLVAIKVLGENLDWSKTKPDKVPSVLAKLSAILADELVQLEEKRHD